MQTTEREKAALIKQYIGYMTKIVGKYKGKLPLEDYEELRSSCLMGVSRAIDQYPLDSPYKLKAFVGVNVVHAISDWLEWYRSEGRTHYRNWGSTFTDLEPGEGIIETISSSYNICDLGDCPFHEGMLDTFDWGLTTSILRDKGILSDKEWFILDKKYEGYLDKEIATMLGSCRTVVQRNKEKAQKKLQEVI
jgi:DNA-directed RNA polymerase specialized sigma subunit